MIIVGAEDLMETNPFMTISDGSIGDGDAAHGRQPSRTNGATQALDAMICVKRI
jgi:hypothetical protein